MTINERSWVLTGGHLFGQNWWARYHSTTEGNPGAVACDYEWALEREEQIGDVLGFMHTHPSFPATPSQRDLNTMWAWVASFGKPLLCAIDGTNGLRGYWFMDDTSNPQKCRLHRLPGLIIARGAYGKQQIPS